MASPRRRDSVQKEQLLEVGGMFSRQGTPAPVVFHQKRVSEAQWRKMSEEWLFNKTVGERVARMEESVKENLRRNGASAYCFRVENY